MDGRTTTRRDLLQILGLALPAGALLLRPRAGRAQAEGTRQAIEKANAQFIEALKRGDAAACAALYAENARVMGPNAPMARGRQAIQAYWQGAIDSGVKEATLAVQEVEEHGDTAIEVGTYTLTVQPRGAQPVKDEGKYVVIWKRQPDRAWKLAVDIFNSDLPPAK